MLFGRMKAAFLAVSLAGLVGACSGGSDGPAPPPPPANRAPVFASPTAVSVPENTTAPVLTISVSDPDGDTLTLSLSGPDASAFALNTARELSFLTPPDFENPTDATGNNVYEVTVSASDGRLSATLNLMVTVENVDELPAGITRLDFYENSNTGNIAIVETDDGSSLKLFGKRTETGLPTRLDGFQFSVTDPDDSTVDVRGTAFNNADGQLARIVYESGETFDLVYNAAGLSAMIYTSADGLTKESVQVPEAAQSEAGPAGTSTKSSIASRTLLNIRSGQPVRLLSSGVYEPVVGPTGHISKEILSASLANTQPVNVQVTECGRPVSGAYVLLFQGGMSLSNTHFAQEVSPGLYRANFPVDAAPGASVTDMCNETREVVTIAGVFCSAGGTEAAFSIAGLCTAFSAGVAVKGCLLAAGSVLLYCTVVDPFLFVADQFGGDDFCIAAGGITDYITDANVSYFARVFAPAGGYIDSPESSASRFGPYPAVSVDLSEQSGPPISVKTAPADPDPLQGYEVQSTISCRANASSALISVSGTDSYFDQTLCFLPEREGSCNLWVPGAVEGVVDTITVSAGVFVATLTVIF